jgi:hypothetical protein
MPKSMSLRTGLPPLEVAMDNAERVGRLERLEDLLRVLARGGHGDPALAVDEGGERLALEKLHHDEGVAARCAVDVHDLDDMNAPNLRGDLRLLEEPLNKARPARELRVQHLDGDARAEDLVLRLVHGAHPPVAE